MLRGLAVELDSRRLWVWRLRFRSREGVDDPARWPTEAIPQQRAEVTAMGG